MNMVYIRLMSIKRKHERRPTSTLFTRQTRRTVTPVTLKMVREFTIHKCNRRNQKVKKKSDGSSFPRRRSTTWRITRVRPLARVNLSVWRRDARRGLIIDNIVESAKIFDLFVVDEFHFFCYQAVQLVVVICVVWLQSVQRRVCWVGSVGEINETSNELSSFRFKKTHMNSLAKDWNNTI